MKITEQNLAALALTQELSSKVLALNTEPYSSAISMISVKDQPKYCFSRFFMIKSYTEEDVHKAIKYFIWSSTEKGNKILDQAYYNLDNLKRKPPVLDEEGKRALANA